MIKTIIQLVFITGFSVFSVKGQSLTPEQYIALYKDVAIREMKRMGVPAAITLAQGLLETECGNSVLVKKSNNHFGIKCKSTWTAGGVSHDDDALGECFRTYKTAEESYRDHSNFLRGGERYAFLFDLDPTDYKAWARGLKKAGYATNPKYPNILIRHIEQYNLQQYSLAGAPGVPKFEPEKYKDDKIEFDSSVAMQGEPKMNTVAVATVAQESTGDETTSFLSDRPGQVMEINGSKCIYAKKGTSLLAVASAHRISLHKLLDINELEDDGLLEEDQLLFLQKKSRAGEKDYVVVQKKETLYDIAQKNGIQLESLLEYNQLGEDGDVFPGTKIYLRAPVAVAARDKAANQNVSVSGSVVYEVKPKDGLYTVAKKYSVTVQQLREWNNLVTDDLRIGQQLIVGK